LTLEVKHFLKTLWRDLNIVALKIPDCATSRELPA